MTSIPQKIDYTALRNGSYGIKVAKDAIEAIVGSIPIGQRINLIKLVCTAHNDGVHKGAGEAQERIDDLKEQGERYFTRLKEAQSLAFSRGETIDALQGKIDDLTEALAVAKAEISAADDYKAHIQRQEAEIKVLLGVIKVLASR